MRRSLHLSPPAQSSAATSQRGQLCGPVSMSSPRTDKAVRAPVTNAGEPAMTFLKGFVLLVVIGCAVLGGPAHAAAVWLDDLPRGQAQAKTERKFVLIHFSGSDWCGWCMKLRKEVFAKPDFESYARSNLVLVRIDFPK